MESFAQNIALCHHADYRHIDIQFAARVVERDFRFALVNAAGRAGAFYDIAIIDRLTIIKSSQRMDGTDIGREVTTRCPCCVDILNLVSGHWTRRVITPHESTHLAEDIPDKTVFG